MPRRTTRITPKVRRRVKRVFKSPESLNKSRKERFSTEESETNKRQTTARRTGRTASKRKAESPEKDTPSSRYSSSSSVDNESQEESVQVPKKKRYVQETKTTRAKSIKKSVENRKANIKIINQEKTGKTRESRTTKCPRKERKTTERIRDLIVTKKVYSKWKPLGTSTKNYIKQVITDTLPKIIGNIPSEKSKEEVQHCLNHLENRVLVKMNKIRGPSQQPDYSTIEQESKKVEKSLTSVNSQLSMIEDELQEQRRLLESEEEKLKTITSQLTKETNANDQPLHPLLEKTFTTSLNLPMISKEAINLPIPKIPAELGKGAQRLSKTLSKLSNNMNNIGLTQWLESVSQLQASLNQT